MPKIKFDKVPCLKKLRKSCCFYKFLHYKTDKKLTRTAQNENLQRNYSVDGRLEYFDLHVVIVVDLHAGPPCWLSR